MHRVDTTEGGEFRLGHNYCPSCAGRMADNSLEELLPTKILDRLSVVV